jgi:predicted small metal-binding protein
VPGRGCGLSWVVHDREQEELVKHVELHAKEAHPGLELEPEQVEQLIKTTA